MSHSFRTTRSSFELPQARTVGDMNVPRIPRAGERRCVSLVRVITYTGAEPHLKYCSPRSRDALVARRRCDRRSDGLGARSPGGVAPAAGRTAACARALEAEAETEACSRAPAA